MILGRPTKLTRFFTGTIALFAVLMVVGYIEVELFLDHPHGPEEMLGEPLILFVLNESGVVGSPRLYTGQLLGALGLACWGTSAPIVRGSVAVHGPI